MNPARTRTLLARRPLSLRGLAGVLALVPTFTLAFALAGCGGGGGDAGGSGSTRWSILGSSTAEGWGASAGFSWAALLAADARPVGATVDNRARAGAVTWQAMPEAAARPGGRPATLATMDIDTVLAERPRLLLLAFPSNDTLAGYPAEETVANLSALRERALAAGTAVVVLSTQPRDDASAAHRATMREIDDAMARQAGACFVALQAALADAGGGLAAAFDSGDGMHPNDAGHALIHQRVQAVVSAHLADGRCSRP